MIGEYKNRVANAHDLRNVEREVQHVHCWAPNHQPEVPQRIGLHPTESISSPWSLQNLLFSSPSGEAAAPTPHGVRYKFPVAQVLRFSKSQESNAVNGTFTWLPWLPTSLPMTNGYHMTNLRWSVHVRSCKTEVDPHAWV